MHQDTRRIDRSKEIQRNILGTKKLAKYIGTWFRWFWLGICVRRARSESKITDTLLMERTRAWARSPACAHSLSHSHTNTRTQKLTHSWCHPKDLPKEYIYGYVLRTTASPCFCRFNFIFIWPTSTHSTRKSLCFASSNLDGRPKGKTIEKRWLMFRIPVGIQSLRCFFSSSESLMGKTTVKL